MTHLHEAVLFINEDILVDSTYLIESAAESFQILLYLAHQDIFAILKDRATGQAAP